MAGKDPLPSDGGGGGGDDASEREGLRASLRAKITEMQTVKELATLERSADDASAHSHILRAYRGKCAADALALRRRARDVRDVARALEQTSRRCPEVEVAVTSSSPSGGLHRLQGRTAAVDALRRALEARMEERWEDINNNANGGGASGVGGGGGLADEEWWDASPQLIRGGAGQVESS